ncbi:S8 family serine peptidase [Pseudoduganella sp. FT55W]|uniref:S8 family serine peptidase n=1 Tax=Duganella rivi TaxID=2666083 RepID=A0A7X4GRD6_9BURK|nr:S8 family peptidase [Duganella rivi]MYM67790.1 S8 family serine peptidase [Duganella rivi]
MNKLLISAGTLMLLGLVQGVHAAEARMPYLVQLDGKPAASYTGGIASLKATMPVAGQKLALDSPDVQRYGSYLEQKQRSLLAVAPQAKLLHSYKLAYNGFSAMLTRAEARALKAQPGVLSVQREQARQVDTHYTPTYLGLDGPNGLWSKAGGDRKAGENIVIGVIDTGLWPENPAFADRVDAHGAPTFDSSGTLAYGAPPASWKGACVAGEGFSAQSCNNKLIGARYYNDSFKADGRTLHWTEFESPRDSVNAVGSRGGHGTHTASTAAGNHGVTARLDGVAAGLASGMAPRARLAVYKVCWTYNDPDAVEGSTNKCYPGDAIAAVEQAIKDGVNVLNFSISGDPFSVDDPVDQAFLGAANAGIFVATSAGNAGPYYVPSAHGVPWMTAAAAATHDRQTGAEVTLDDGTRFVGASLNSAPLPASRAVLARDAGATPFEQLSEADQAARSQCFTAADRAANGASAAGALDPAYVKDRVVVCERGVNARKDKSVAVKEAGGVGMIMVDNNNGLVFDVQSLPSVHVSTQDGDTIKAYVSSHPDARIAMSAYGLQANPAPSPMVAPFSSRGPGVAPGLLKPDLAAPGVEVLAGVTPVKTEAERNAIAAQGKASGAAWNFFTGTSMASPHVAGLAALLMQQHPDWSPAAIRSALMTTAGPTEPDIYVEPWASNSPWGQGAGMVQPLLATDPGLVYDLAPNDYIRFLCGANSISVSAEQCQQSGKVAATNLNQPSIVAPALMEQQSFVRSVTNVGGKPAIYTATMSGLEGYSYSVTPSTLALEPGETKSFTVALKNVNAPHWEWRYGSLEWRDGEHLVHSTVAARAMVLDVYEYLNSSRPADNKLLPMYAGFSSKLAIQKSGLTAAKRTTFTRAPGKWDDYGVADCRAGGSASVAAMKLSIPAGTTAARLATYYADTAAVGQGTDNLYLMILNSSGVLVGISDTEFTSEHALLGLAPEPGDYTVCVAVKSSWAETSTFAISSWILKPGQQDANMKVLSPSATAPGAFGTLAVSWNGLDPAQRYFGLVQLKVDGKVQSNIRVMVDSSAQGAPLELPQAEALFGGNLPRTTPMKFQREPGAL